MKKILIIFLGLFLTSLSAATTTKHYSKSATGEGYGVTYSEAVDNAIAEAVTKLNGAYIKSTNSFSQTQMESSNDGTNINAQFSQKISKATNGRFSTFDVVSTEQTPTGYKVIVNVTKNSSVKSYKTPGKENNRRRIVVYPAYKNNDFYIFGKSANQVSNDLLVKIESEIHKTRKFNLLDRSANLEYINEMSIINSTGASDEKLQMNRVLGSDYMLRYTLEDAGVSENKANPLIGNLGGGSSANLSLMLSYQIIIPATRETRFSDTITITNKAKEPSSLEYNRILDNVAQRIVENIQAAIYPPKVEKVSNNQAVFTQKMNIGAVLECYKLGAKIVDSYTKETTGNEEIYTGKVEVVNASAKISYANIIEGSVIKGNICKFVDNANKSGVSHKDNYQVPKAKRLPGGGFEF
ncbi:hypothetical protein [Campylobacter sp. MG1]|uniref:hypothetical protein n=1 Tax=Campylobacter sp. MG1 TaxID=2976332 RepID=UPI00226D1BC4|nr:hypothetical protein [Campylobacter sp. MG1]